MKWWTESASEQKFAYKQICFHSQVSLSNYTLRLIERCTRCFWLRLSVSVGVLRVAL
jgi:hypothetical protein